MVPNTTRTPKEIYRRNLSNGTGSGSLLAAGGGVRLNEPKIARRQYVPKENAARFAPGPFVGRSSTSPLSIGVKSRNHAEKLRQRANRQKRTEESMASRSIGATCTGTTAATTTAAGNVQSVGAMGLQSVGKMVGEGYQFMYDASGNFRQIPLETQPIAIGTINCDHQVPSCDCCGDDAYTVPCEGCGMRFCVNCVQEGRRLGRDCVCGMPPALESTLRQLRGMICAYLAAPMTTSGA